MQVIIRALHFDWQTLPACLARAAEWVWQASSCLAPFVRLAALHPRRHSSSPCPRRRQRAQRPHLGRPAALELPGARYPAGLAGDLPPHRHHPPRAAAELADSAKG